MTERRDSAPPLGGDSDARRSRLAGFLPADGPRRRVPTAFAMALLTAMGCGIAYYAFAAARSWLVDRPEFLLEVDRIELEPAPPEAIRGGRETILREVRDRGGLSAPIRLLAPDYDAIRRAFALHSPWIAGVERIDASRPGRLIVEVLYHRPAARVALAGIRDRVLVVAEDATVLPAEEVSTAAMEPLPTIFGLSSATEVPPGLILGVGDSGKIDPTVSGAVALAVAVGRYPPGIQRIVWVVEPTGYRHFMVLTRGKVWVDWRNAPGEEVAGEPPASAKIERLARWEEQRAGRVVGETQVLRFVGDGVVLVDAT